MCLQLQLQMRTIIIYVNCQHKDCHEEHLSCPLLLPFAVEISFRESVMVSQLARLMFAGLVASNCAFADAERMPDWNAQTLSGDWGGARSDLYSKGLTLDFIHKSDLLSNASGGIRRGSVWIANTEAAVRMDMAKLAGWNATTAFFQYHVQHGNQSKDFNRSYVGSFAGVDNIETGISTGQFFQAWLQRNPADDGLSVLAGLYAIDSEFYVTETSGVFIQPPYGMSAEVAQTGKHGPPIFPVGALAVRLKFKLNDYYLQAALTDGVPGDPGNRHGTHIKLGDGDGTFSIIELGHNVSMEGKVFNKTSLGLWRYSARAADLVSGDLRPDQGYYLLAERTLLAEQNDPAQGLSGFVRLGTANENVHQTEWSGSLGLRYQGLLDGRDDDTTGIAVTTSHASSKYRQLNASDSYEAVVEISYRAQFQPWLAVQPVVQRIFNPNMDTALENSWVAGMRLFAAF